MRQPFSSTPDRWLPLAVVLITAAVFSTDAAAQKSLIINGSFEEGPRVERFINVQGGATTIKGWVVAGEGIDYIGSLWRASNGAHSIDLDGSARSTMTRPYNQGGIAQTFSTIPGKRYEVTFDLAGNGFGPPKVKPMSVSVAGQETDFTFDLTGKSPSNMGWVTKSVTFTAVSTSTTLEFHSRTVSPNVGWGAVIDNVSVTELSGSAHH